MSKGTYISLIVLILISIGINLLFIYYNKNDKVSKKIDEKIKEHNVLNEYDLINFKKDSINILTVKIKDLKNKYDKIKNDLVQIENQIKLKEITLKKYDKVSKDTIFLKDSVYILKIYGKKDFVKYNFIAELKNEKNKIELTNYELKLEFDSITIKTTIFYDKYTGLVKVKNETDSKNIPFIFSDAVVDKTVYVVSSKEYEKKIYGTDYSFNIGLAYDILNNKIVLTGLAYYNIYKDIGVYANCFLTGKSYNSLVIGVKKDF